MLLRKEMIKRNACIAKGFSESTMKNRLRLISDDPEKPTEGDYELAFSYPRENKVIDFWLIESVYYTSIEQVCIQYNISRRQFSHRLKSVKYASTEEVVNI